MSKKLAVLGLVSALSLTMFISGCKKNDKKPSEPTQTPAVSSEEPTVIEGTVKDNKDGTVDVATDVILNATTDNSEAEKETEETTVVFNDGAEADKPSSEVEAKG